MRRVADDSDFRAIELPATREWLLNERLGPTFVDYMATWKGFVLEG